MSTVEEPEAPPASWLTRFWRRLSSFRTSPKAFLPAPDSNDGNTEQGNVEHDDTTPLIPAVDPHIPWLEALVADASDGARLNVVGDENFWKHIDAVWQRGDELLASQWIEKFLKLTTTGGASATALRL